MEIVPTDMRGIGRALLELAVIGAVLITAWIVFPHATRTFLAQALESTRPCSYPLSYRIGTVDPRFELSTAQVAELLAGAASNWNTAAGKTVLSAEPGTGVVTVNFVYDNRQQRASTMNTIKSSVNDDKSTYDALVGEYKSAQSAYQAQKASYDAAAAAFQGRTQVYQQQVASWNSRGGAPADVYAQLQAEKTQLDSQQAALDQLVRSINASAASLNALSGQINQLIDTLNLKVQKYNAVGAQGAGEFEEGLFTSSPGSETIDIYEYATATQLHRVLAHEFGHALGLEHVDDPQAIMYKLNESTNEHLTVSDIQELDRACRL